MRYEVRERIEGLLDLTYYEALREAIDEVANQMLEDGFEYSDVKEFIKVQLDEILGYDNKE
jgi:vacuolar-type H+-ATPase subunit E/Vma4